MSARQGGLIVGNGALGFGFAAYMALSGAPVTLLGRQGALDEVQLEHDGGEFKVALTPRSDCGYALAIVATKGPHLMAAADQHGEELSRAAVRCLFRNGLSQEPVENLGEAADCVIWACAEKRSAVEAVWRRDVKVTIPKGWRGEQVMRRVLAVAPVKVEEVENIEVSRFRKLMVNAGLNTMAALERCGCDGLMARPSAVKRAVAIAREVANLAAAAKVPVDVEPEGHIRAAFDHMGTFVPSMEQDRRSRRPIEIYEIVEAPLALGRQLGVEMPTLEKVRNKLRHRIAGGK